jgi:hypothetical protein
MEPAGVCLNKSERSEGGRRVHIDKRGLLGGGGQCSQSHSELKMWRPSLGKSRGRARLLHCQQGVAPQLRLVPVEIVLCVALQFIWVVCWVNEWEGSRPSQFWQDIQCTPAIYHYLILTAVFLLFQKLWHHIQDNYTAKADDDDDEWWICYNVFRKLTFIILLQM